MIASPFLDDIAELFPRRLARARRRRLLADVVWSVVEAPTERERCWPRPSRRLRPVRCCGRGRDRPARSSPSRRWPTCATGRSSPRARSRHSPRARSGGWWSASCNLINSSPIPTRSPVARSFTRCSSACSPGSGGALTPQTLPRAEQLLHEEMRGPEAASDRSTAGPRSGDRGACCDPARDRGGAAALSAAGGCRRLRLAADRDRAAVRAGPRVRGRDATGELDDGSEQVLLSGIIDRVDADPATRAV